LVTSPSFDLSNLIAGVDTHIDTHTLAILTATGGVVLTATFTADQRGYRKLIRKLQETGSVAVVGVEGTNSYGAGLARSLTSAGYTVKEVLRPTRQVRRMHGKSDDLDAVEAARTVLADRGVSEAKDSDTPAESLRCLLAARTQLVRSITAFGNCIRSLLTTAPEEVRAKYRDLPTPTLIRRLAACRPGQQIDCPRAAVLTAMKQQAQICEDARKKADRLERQMHSILSANYPQVLAIYGAGAVVAAQLVITAGGNPQRIRDEAAFASLCGVSPIPASSGRTNRHRLNRGGDRRANSALHRIALVRMRHDERTREYVTRREREGRSTREVMRCLKRAIAREAYRALTSKHPAIGASQDLKILREAKNVTQSEAANALDTYPSRISDIEQQRRPLPELTTRYRQWLETA
jgi:transposase